MQIGVRHSEAAFIRLLVKHLCRYHEAMSDCTSQLEDKQQSIKDIESVYWVNLTYNNAVFNCQGASWNEYPITSSERYSFCSEMLC